MINDTVIIIKWTCATSNTLMIQTSDNLRDNKLSPYFLELKYSFLIYQS